MTISTIAIRRPVTTMMFFIAIVLLGAVSFHQLPVQLVPDVTFPAASAYCRYSGLSVKDTVEKVTKPMEAIVASSPNVREIDSTTYPGHSRIEIQWEFGTDMRFATLDLEEKLARFRKTLPQRGVYVRLRAFSTDFAQSMFMWINVLGKDDREVLGQIAEDLLQPQLEAIDGVADVMAFGHSHESIDVVFDRDKLAAHGLSLNRTIGRIRAAVATERTLGQLRGPRENINLSIGELVEREDELARLPLDDSAIVRLNDVARVFRNERRSDYVSRINGRNYVGLMIRKEADANPLRMTAKVREVLREIAGKNLEGEGVGNMEDAGEGRLPPGYRISIEEDVAAIIRKIIHQVTKLALIGAFFAMVVLMLFVRNFRMAAIVFTAIPISVITTFNLMYFGGLSLNIITLIGLALGVGLLVDNAIVVLENIFRHFEHGGHAVEASGRATDEVWRALLATTLTNVVVFTPVLFAEGELGLIFREGALAIIFPVTVSLLVALTLVPMVTSRILARRERRGAQRRVKRRRARRLGWIHEWIRRHHPYWPSHMRRPRRLYRELYMMTLRSALRHRLRVFLLTGLAVFVTNWVCCSKISKGKMRQTTEGSSFGVYVQVLPGTSRERLIQVLDAIEAKLQDLPELERTRSYGHPDEYSTVRVTLVPKEERDRKLHKVRESILEFIGTVPGATLSLRPFETEGEQSSGFQMAYNEGGVVEVHGAHWEALEWIAEGLARQIELIPGVSRVEVEESLGAPEMQFTVDRRRAALFNIHASDLANYFSTSQRYGEFSQLTMERGERELDVLLRMGRPGKNPEDEEEGDSSLTLEEIKSMEVFSPLGGTVPLAEIGHFRKTMGERRLRRHNMRYSLRMIYYLEPRVARPRLEREVNSLLEEARLPAGYAAEVGGEGHEVDENVRQVIWMLAITAILIYMVMASVFESLLSPLVIMFTFPLAAIGVLWGLTLTGLQFEELAMLGVVVLAGIVVNNGIVMMDFIQMLRRQKGFRRTAAILTACRARLRPILMTALTTILGLLPMALRSDEEIKWSGLAVVIIGGLSVSTVLTLVVIPSMLMIVEDTVWFVWRLLKRVAARLWRLRWLLYFFWPPWMRDKRLDLAPAGAPLPAAFAPTFATAMQRVAVSDLRTEIEPTPALEPAGADFDSRPPGIEVRHVRMTYPVFRMHKLLNVIPSRRYKWGARPPEGVEALRGVSLSMGKGVSGLVGPNGAGKTTLLHIITGLIRPTCGQVTVNGIDLAKDRRRARSEIGYLPQSFGLHGNFTAREYLTYYSLIQGVAERAERRRNVEAVLDQVGLRDVGDERVGTFSGGMRQRLGIARLLLTLPRVIIVDEPTAGLDPIERVKFRLLLSELGQDRTVLLSTHIIDDISSSCRNLALLNNGRILYEGTPDGLVDSARNRIWEIVGQVEDEATIKERYRLLHKKAAGPDRALFRLIAAECDLPDARRVEPSLEDAYIFAITQDESPPRK